MQYKDYEEFSPPRMEAKFRRARIPAPFFLTFLEHVQDALDMQAPQGAVEGYFANLREGRVLRATELR